MARSSKLGNAAAKLGLIKLGVAGGPQVLNVTASTTINLVSVALAPQAIIVSSTSTIDLDDTGGGVRSAKDWVVNAVTQIVLGGVGLVTAVGGGPRMINVSGTTGIVFRDAASQGTGQIFIRSANSGIALAGTAFGGRHAFFVVTASNTINLRTTAREYLSPIHVSATTALGVASVAGVQAFRTKFGDAASHVVLDPQADSDGQIRIVNVSARDVIAIEATPIATQVRIISVSATSKVNLYGNTALSGARNVSASTGIVLSTRAGKISAFVASASSFITLSPSASSRGRTISVSATTSMGLSPSDSSDRFLLPTGTGSIVLTAHASATVGWNDAKATIGFHDLAMASVQLPSGGTVPGGDSNAGLRAVAYSNVSGTFPFSYAETPSGLLLLANGVDPMLRWDGLSGLADTAGVKPPATAIMLAGQDVGTLTGTRYAFCRFVDRNGNVSSISPMSNEVDLGREGLIENIALDSTTGIVTVQSGSHGLSPTDSVVFQGVGGLPISGALGVTTIDPDHFFLTILRLTSGAWSGGGSLTWGVNEVVYQNVPVPTEAKVVRRQILRNLDGAADVFYVDLDTTDLISPTLVSTKDDETLSAGESVPIATSNELPYAARYFPPPSHKNIVASHMGRIFACGEVAIILGNVVPRFGSNVVAGVGTDWPATLAGRLLYVSGATKAYEIAAVDVANQALTLTSNYSDPTKAYATYAIRPAPGERRLVYYTEPGLPEAWPPWNSFAIPEEDDEIVGLMARTGFLYFVEKRHIHRFTMQDEPSEGQDFASINRGCINGRCLVQVENTAYILDEAGIHAFDGGQSTEPISQPIQTIFQSDGSLGGISVDWSADTTLWHASHDPVRYTIRWFVQMAGYDGIYHAICYDYRQKRWFIEQYPSAITASTTGVVGYRRSLVGTSGRRVVVLGEGTLDLVAGSGSTGSVSSADSTSLSDVNASFAANLAGAPVSIVGGTGRRQQRIICDNTSTMLTVVDPWDVALDGTSTYQVGGVQWSWRSGWFEVGGGEDENPQDVMLTYQPTVNPATVDLQLFYDHSSDPRDWAYDVNQDGVSCINGDPNISVNLQTKSCRNGWSLQRFGGHSEVYAYGDQFLQILLAGVQCAESIRIFQITLNGMKTPQED